MVRKRAFLAMLLFLPLLLFSPGINGLASYEKVYDQADLFSEAEREELNEQAIVLSEKTLMDVIIVTTNDSQGKSSSQYALDFYDEHGFGYQGTLDGILYLLNMDEREVYIFTRDKGTDYLDNIRVEKLLDLVYPSLGEERYHESVQIFLEEVGSLMDEGPPAGSLGVQSGESGYAYTGDGGIPAGGRGLAGQLGIYLLISLAVGGIVVGIMAMGNKGRSTVSATTYLQDNSFTMTKNQDRHYNTIVTQQKIQRNNNKSGGSTFSGGPGGGGGGIGGGGRSF